MKKKEPYPVFYSTDKRFKSLWGIGIEELLNFERYYDWESGRLLHKEEYQAFFEHTLLGSKEEMRNNISDLIEIYSYGFHKKNFEIQKNEEQALFWEEKLKQRQKVIENSNPEELKWRVKNHVGSVTFGKTLELKIIVDWEKNCVYMNKDGQVTLYTEYGKNIWNFKNMNDFYKFAYEDSMKADEEKIMHWIEEDHL